MSAKSTSTLSCDSLDVAVPGRQLVTGLHCALQAGDFLAILGQNGAGKSLCLHTLAGLRPPARGSVQLLATALSEQPRNTVARNLALLPQHADDAFPATVFETALSGRHPHVPRWQWENSSDRDIADECLRLMDLHDLHARDVTTLSGGERRRLAIAQVLAQTPQVYLLDEPTNHLDPQHQLEVLQVFADKARHGATVVASLHDVNLAARFATSCLLLFGDGSWLMGPTPQILDAKTLSKLYATPMEAIAWRDHALFVASGPAPPERSH